MEELRRSKNIHNNKRMNNLLEYLLFGLCIITLVFLPHCREMLENIRSTHFSSLHPITISWGRESRHVSSKQLLFSCAPHPFNWGVLLSGDIVAFFSFWLCGLLTKLLCNEPKAERSFIKLSETGEARYYNSLSENLLLRCTYLTQKKWGYCMIRLNSSFSLFTCT